MQDLLFCPDLTVIPKAKQGPENPDDLSSLDSCEYIWSLSLSLSLSLYCLVAVVIVFLSCGL